MILTGAGELIEEFSLDRLRFGEITNVFQLDTGNSTVYFASAQKAWRLELETMQVAERGEVSEPARVHAVAPVVYSGPAAGFSYERLFLDLHSGRAFGGWGIWLVDLVGLGLMGLIVSGILAWRAKQKLLNED